MMDIPPEPFHNKRFDINKKLENDRLSNLENRVDLLYDEINGICSFEVPFFDDNKNKLGYIRLYINSENLYNDFKVTVYEDVIGKALYKWVNNSGEPNVIPEMSFWQKIKKYFIGD